MTEVMTLSKTDRATLKTVRDERGVDVMVQFMEACMSGNDDLCKLLVKNDPFLKPSMGATERAFYVHRDVALSKVGITLTVDAFTRKHWLDGDSSLAEPNYAA